VKKAAFDQLPVANSAARSCTLKRTQSAARYFPRPQHATARTNLTYALALPTYFVVEATHAQLVGDTLQFALRDAPLSRETRDRVD
jgi:hypothetical protein